MLTAADAGDQRVSGLSVGADDYLANPAASPNSSSGSAHSLAANRELGRACMVAATLCSTQKRHETTHGGRNLDLSAKEFGVLGAVLRAAPAYLSAENLLEQV